MYHDKVETLPGVLGNRGITPFNSGEHGNKRLKASGEQRQFWGTGNMENQDFDFGEQGKMPIFFLRWTREQVPPWEGIKVCKLTKRAMQEQAASAFKNKWFHYIHDVLCFNGTYYWWTTPRTLDLIILGPRLYPTSQVTENIAVHFTSSALGCQSMFLLLFFF